MTNQPEPCHNNLKAAAIGMFDGVHTGHRHLLRCVRHEAETRGLSPSVITFSNHPSTVTTPHSPVKMITGNAEKRHLIEREGIDHIIMLDFTDKLRQLTAREFLTVLHRDHGVRCLIVGFNNHFGSDRTLGFADYVRIGHELGISVVQATEADGPKTSSSIIRRLLESGNLSTANQLLGRNFTLTGTVMEGRQLGRTIGFPTANLLPDSPDRIIPAPGAYAVRLTFADTPRSQMKAMVNIGYRPTVNNNPFDITIEAHILDFSADIYGRTVRLEFIGRLRNEMHFPSLDALKAQLATDAERTRTLLT